MFQMIYTQKYFKRPDPEDTSKIVDVTKDFSISRTYQKME